MSKYDINLRKWVLLALPTFHRRPVLAAVAFALVAPLRDIYVRFLAARDAAAYRLEHGSQVCLLRAVLNDLFDAGHRRITIEDFKNDPVKGKVIFRRGAGAATVVARRERGAPLRVNPRGFGGVNGYDFVVNIPAELKEETDEARLRAVVNMYKLVSKRFVINYIR